MAQLWLLPVVGTEIGSKTGSHCSCFLNSYLWRQPGRRTKGLPSERPSWNLDSLPINNSAWLWKLGPPAVSSACLSVGQYVVKCFSFYCLGMLFSTSISHILTTVCVPASGAVLCCLNPVLNPKQVWANMSISLLRTCLWDSLPVLCIAGWNLVVLSWTWLDVCSGLVDLWLLAPLFDLCTVRYDVAASFHSPAGIFMFGQ